MKMVIMLPLLLFFSLSTLPTHIAKLSNYSDQQALIAFKDALLLDPFNSLLDWSPNHTLCNWTGVVCSSRRQRVVSLNLTGMGLAGPISPFLANLSFLRVLDLKHNSFQGHIPYQLGRLFRLRWLRFSYNNLSGSIPSEFSLLSNLKVMALVQNNLTGIIPPFLGNMSSLTVIDLGGNRFQGPIPVSLSNCTRLQELELCGNHLSGPIPWEFGRLSQLQHVYLWKNQLSGEIPSSVGNWTQLQMLDFANNKLSGTVPKEFGKMQQLRSLVLSLNHLTGVLPTSIGRLSNSLSVLSLNSNEIGGNIPDEIGNLTMLSSLDLKKNRFNGTIPSALCRLPNLEGLNLHTNNLHGRIPECFGQSKRLGLLSLSQNILSGQIPQGLGALPQLRRLDLSHNQLSAIDVSQNNFSGGIPSALESCKGLMYLNLSGNAFEGPIPVSLVNLKNLQYMDLSCNNLSGTIPVAFKKMKMLQHLNLSSNMLTGEVPKGGAFATLDASEIMGNLGLCGGWINLPPCSHSKHKETSVSKKVIIPVVVGIAILTMSLLLVAFSYRWRRSCTPALKVWPPKISYEELVDATGGFSDENLLGIGSFGSVYKGILRDRTNIAVKVLKLQDEHAHQSFSRECNALKRVRHRNVIKIISSCSNLDFKALILPLMSNGSLERWLYPREGGQCKLNLSDRLRISMEIAQGMAYLHHYCFVQVIHRDLKPNNVLLGDDMISYIADFGLSNIIFGNSMDSLTSTDALKGSVGYIAPEYGIGGNISTKGDVYSYGILILELLTRRRPTDDRWTEGINLPKWTEMHFPNRISDVVDNCLLIDAHDSEMSTVMECLTQFIQIGLFCTRESPQERPDMTEIVDRLNTIR
ncbi:hypothetical protein SUGI_0378470, partial [Cryptomeria japonica]